MASLAETLRKRGDDRDAEAWASKAAHAGNSPGIICLAQILRARGDDSAADIWAARAAELDGDMTE
jgi:TPR repeat protein